MTSPSPDNRYAEARAAAEQEADKAPPLTDEQVRDLQALLQERPEEKRGAA